MHRALPDSRTPTASRRAHNPPVSEIALTVSPPRAVIDRPVAVRVGGLAPGQPVTLEARLDDHWGDRWLAEATFVADGAGQVDLGRDAPVAGTYQGVDPMGLFWAMHQQEGAAAAPAQSAPVVYHLRALVDGQAIGAASAERLVLAEGVVERELRERWLVGSFFRPPGDGPFPAVVTLAGSSGGLGPAYHQAALLASNGVAALALAYFRMPWLPADLANIPLEYFDNALDWLADREDVRADAIGVLGSSRGGELALLLGATFPRVAAVVAYAPSHVVWLGQLADSPEQVPAWRYRGQNLRAVPPAVRLSRFRPPAGDEPGDEPIAYTPWFLDCLDDAEAERAATIPVERIGGPVMLVSGRDDAVWPSTLMADRVLARLAAHRHPYPRQHLAYDAAGHTINRPPYWPTTAAPYRHVVSGRLIAVGGTPAGTAHARADSWPRVVRFLQESLT
jgi:dienelactone hydrolase